jgi:hypothetical protein
MPSTLYVARSHREREPCGTPTYCPNAFALIAAGPTNRRSIRLLNAVL